MRRKRPIAEAVEDERRDAIRRVVTQVEGAGRRVAGQLSAHAVASVKKVKPLPRPTHSGNNTIH